MMVHIDESFKKYMEHKKVCFVGACPNLKGRGLGSLIDSYDIVVRSNNFWRPFTNDVKELEKDYGARCDVVYINRQYHRETKPFPLAAMNMRGIKWLCFKGLTNNVIVQYNKIINTRTYTPIIKEVTPVLPSATAGLYLCIDILKQNPDEFYYTGIDFFASRKPVFEYDNYQEYLPGYLPDNIRKQGNLLNAGKKEDAHDFLGNAQYFWKLFKQFPNFKTDDFIADLLYSIVNGKIKQGEIKW